MVVAAAVVVAAAARVWRCEVPERFSVKSSNQCWKARQYGDVCGGVIVNAGVNACSGGGVWCVRQCGE